MTLDTRPLGHDLYYIGASDRRIALFENMYPVPQGASYNSYLLLDEKTVLFDTVDRAVCAPFLQNLASALGPRKLDYIVVQHMEPDHCAALGEVLSRYPEAQVICSAGAAKMIVQFFGVDISPRSRIVREGETLCTGAHTLTFIMAPMVHWPEVMMTWDASSRTLFSADAFGSFGALDGAVFNDERGGEAQWLPEARRYYTNIVGKYGPQVQAVLKKAAGLDIARVCPLHGPIWRQNLDWLLEKYGRWSAYAPEEKAVLIVCGSVYGGTQAAASLLAARLAAGGAANTLVYDVSKTHVSELVAQAFRCSHLVVAGVTYNAGIFTPLKNFLLDLQAHGLRGRRYALIENGSWAPLAGKQMEALFDQMPDMRKVGNTVTIRSALSEDSRRALDALGGALLEDLQS